MGQSRGSSLFVGVLCTERRAVSLFLVCSLMKAFNITLVCCLKVSTSIYIRFRLQPASSLASPTTSVSIRCMSFMCMLFSVLAHCSRVPDIVGVFELHVRLCSVLFRSTLYWLPIGSKGVCRYKMVFSVRRVARMRFHSV